MQTASKILAHVNHLIDMNNAELERRAIPYGRDITLKHDNEILKSLVLREEKHDNEILKSLVL